MVNGSSAKAMHKIHSACCCFGPESERFMNADLILERLILLPL